MLRLHLDPLALLDCADRGIVIDRCGGAGAGWKTPSDDMGVDWSDPAHEELAPMPRVDNAMASAHAALTTAFVTAV